MLNQITLTPTDARPTGHAAMTEFLPGMVLRDRWRPNWRARTLGAQVFLSNDAGSWTILTGSEFAELRSVAIPHHLYSRLETRELIITERNAGCAMRSYERWASNYFGAPSLHILGMTRRCNLSCLYCHAAVVPEDADASRFDMSRDTARHIVEFAFQSPSDRVHFEFQGGEASLNFEVVQYVHDLAFLLNLKHRRRVTFSMVTNGVALGDEVLDWVAATGMKVTTSVELPGPVEEHLRLDWKGRDHTDAVWATRQRLAQRGVFVPQLIVIGRNNIHRMREHIDAAAKDGQDSIFFSPVQKLGFSKKHWPEVGIEMDEFYAFYADAMEHLFSYWDQGILIEERYFSLALEKLFSEHDTKYTDWRNPNGNVFSVLAYDQNGDVFACDEGRGHADFRIGNVRRDSFGDVVGSARALELVSYSLREHPECQSCGYKAFCGVSPIVSKGECGRLDTPPLVSSTCQRTLHLMDYVVRLMVERPHRIDQALMIIGLTRG
jgi:uncharacterized protein